VPGALFEHIRRSAARNADAPALTFIGGRRDPYTFAEVLEKAEELAERFGALELPDDAPVGILLRTQEDQVLHYLGLLCAGIVPAILTPPNPKLDRAYYVETMVRVLARSHFAAIVTDVDGLEVPSLALQPHDLQPAEGQRPCGAKGPKLVAAFLQFSSGTTGIKRGVPVTDECVVAQVRTYGDAIGLEANDTIVSWLPLYHDMGFITCLNMPLVWGVHTVMMDPIHWVSNPSLFLREASNHSATLAWNPNFAYAFMAHRIRDRDLDGVDLSSLRGLVNCSEPVTHASQELFSKRFRSHGLRDDVFWGCYAMAETTFAVTHGKDADLDAVGPAGASVGATRVSVGTPLPNVELRIVSDDGTTLPDRRLGEIQVRTPFTFSGYFNDPESTDEAFVDGWYRTGDVGYRVGDALYVMDRRKDVMIVGGVNIFPRDIEETVSSLPGVISGRVAAFAEFDLRLQTERAVVLCESDLDDPVREQALVIEARQKLLAAFQIASFEVHVVPPGWLVKSSAGKISRTQNRMKWLGEQGRGSVT
jgi:acyl-CoA synthetase (AMP-forming)/AMP-acid ligase II